MSHVKDLIVNGVARVLGKLVANEIDSSGQITAKGFKVTGAPEGFLKANGGTDTNKYLPLTGGKLTGDLVLASSANIAGENTEYLSINITSGSIGINKSSNTVCSIDNSGKITADGGVVIQSNSKLNIGSATVGVTTSGNTNILTVDSAITAQGNIQAPAFYETSDIRKKDIKSDVPLDKCYDLLDKCQTIVYTLKDSNKEQVGLIAQEVEEFFPEIVYTDNEGFKTLDYSRLTVICLKLIKDLISRIKKLEDNGRDYR